MTTNEDQSHCITTGEKGNHQDFVLQKRKCYNTEEKIENVHKWGEIRYESRKEMKTVSNFKF